MDPVADMITHIRNTGAAGREKAAIPYSKLKHAICDVLVKEGFLKSCETKTEKNRKFLSVEIILDKRIPKIQGVKRISKTSKRIYKKADELFPVRSGYGVSIISTSKGVMSGKAARKARLGGELLFSIW